MLVFIGQFILVVILLATVTLVAILALIFISGIASNVVGAPYVPIRRRYVRALLSWGDLSADDVFCDLGCGDGRMLISAADDFNVKKTIGYEVAPWPYIKARFLSWYYGVSDRVVIVRQNFLKTDLSDSSFIYIYLFPKLVDRLATKLARELRVGTKILCPSFPIDLARHQEFNLIKSEKVGRITAYLYQKI